MPGCSFFHIASNPATSQVHFVFKGLEGEINTWCFIGASGFFNTFSDSLHIFVLDFCTKIHARTHFRVCEVVCKLFCLIFFQTVSWTVFLCNVCLGCPKTEAHFCQNAQMSFLVAFFPPVPFLYPFLYCLVPWHPGLESLVCLDLNLWNSKLQTERLLPAACGWSVGPGLAFQTGDSALEITHIPRQSVPLTWEYLCRLFHGDA